MSAGTPFIKCTGKNKITTNTYIIFRSLLGEGAKKKQNVLQRIYGIALPKSNVELQEHLQLREEAKQRDHRKNRKRFRNIYDSIH